MSNQRNQRPVRLAMPVVAMVAAALLAGCGKQSSVDPELTATLIQPVARVEIQAVTITPGTRTGEQIYKSICAACHDSGAVGAPKTGDAAGWSARLGLGFEGLTASAIAGKGAMPARGGGSDLTDTEVARAVAYLANTVGAGYTEPPVEQ
ncbi:MULTISPECIES: c-type cytochrome [unclassified Thauera]|uniref:c-type cytochrome n=1 Tax=unclassified Thauera TaxID=2609274 RepID=UPI0002CE3D92|nr:MULTISPECIES: c-type cytochrome [unclassified Thauera]ENO81969.1 cytochrome C class I [Thauera sp. 27]WBL64490.1 c-type cytochrome [Thauera sp. WB-2]